jgi:hypothetical protein
MSYSQARHEGFELNPYDTYIANKMANEKQRIIAWYVDGNKILQVDPEVVTGIVDKIEARFRKMIITRGKKHVFLRMNITYLDNQTVEISMPDYVKESIAELGENVNKTAPSPAKRDLYKNCGKRKMLKQSKSEIFHSVVAKLLDVSHWGHLDIQLPIAFLCTRVSCSTGQDWTKLKQVLEYLNRTLEDIRVDVRVIGADNLAKMKARVDASYAVHMDMKSHMGGVVSFGRGAVMGKSSKQKRTQKVLSKQNWLVQATVCLTQFGHGSFWKNRATLSNKTHFTRITRVQLDLRRTGGSHVSQILGTSTSPIFSSKTGSRLKGSA